MSEAPSISVHSAHHALTITRRTRKVEAEPEPEQAEYEKWSPSNQRVLERVQQTLESQRQIFVAIASYRDEELVPTLRDLLEKAKWPERLRFGICLQGTPEQLAAFPYYGDERFSVIAVSHEESRGCCWARHQMQTLMRDERYYLQLDSHHRFVQDWDALCLQMLHAAASSQPIISTYLPGYTPATAAKDVEARVLYEIQPTGFTPMGLPKQIPAVGAHNESEWSEPRLARLLAGGFIFTFASWAREVPYDPALYFNGEELSLMLRSWTRGWDVFTPNRVVAFHYYKREAERKHWQDHKQWNDLNRVSIDKVLAETRGHNLGTHRTLAQYCDFAGIYFDKRKLRKTIAHVTNGTRAPSPVRELKEELKTSEVQRALYFDGGLLTARDGGGWLEYGSNLSQPRGVFEPLGDHFYDSTRHLHLRIGADGKCQAALGDPKAELRWKVHFPNGRWRNTSN